jgi:nitrate reductase NapE component
MFRKSEIQSPAQTGCGKLAAFMAIGIVTIVSVAGYGIYGLVA